MKFLSIPLLLSTLTFYQGWCQPDRVWEVQQSPETANYNSLVQYPNSKPLKIRLVNYEQRHLASRHRDGSNSRGYLESVRQRARGTLTRPVQSAVPIAQVETKPLIDPKEDRLPSLDSLHQARSLFENNRSDGSPLAPLSEFELKSDYQLQKSMQRTTVSTKTYPTQSPIDADTNSQPTTTTAIPPTTTAQYVPETVTPAAFTVTPPYPSFLAPNLTQQQGFNPLGFGFPPQPPPVPLPPTQSSTPNPGAQFEQLGCGFDLLTNTCKDVFAIGWCNACEDFGNVFLHDCKCTNPNKDRNATTQASTTTIDPVLAAAIAANNQQFLLQQQQQQQQVNFLQQQQQNLLQQQQQQIQQQQQQIQQSQQNASTLGTVPAFFVQPTFFGY